MTSSMAGDETCSICLEILNKPVGLPCKHRFCADCLEQWRSKYDATSERSCPQCRSKLPPTREMLSQINMLKSMCEKAESYLHDPDTVMPLLPLPGEPGYGDDVKEHFLLTFLSPLPENIYMDLAHGLREADEEEQQFTMRTVVEMQLTKVKNDIEQRTQVLKDSGHEYLLDPNNQEAIDEFIAAGEQVVENLPWEINRAAADNDIQEVLKWLGPPPVSPSRLNAKCKQHMDRTLLHEAEYENHTGLMALLLQMGANVDCKSSFGATPFEQAVCFARCEEAGRLLLTWGAKVTDDAVKRMIEYKGQNPALLKLVGYELGGRRCEIVGLQKRQDLNGLKGIVTQYKAKDERYVVKLEDVSKNETVRVRPANLQRRDRTPLDPGAVTLYHGVMPDGRNCFSRGFVAFSFTSLEDAQKFYRDHHEDGPVEGEPGGP